MRIAWFSPLPPVHSGIAAYSVDVLEGVRGAHRVHLFVEDRVWHAAGGHLHAGLGPLIVPLAGPLGLPLYRAFDFPVLNEQALYDLVVYQLGNAACHRYMWPYLLQWPGLVVLHDAALHHARAQALLGDGRADDYRAEFRFNHPGVDPRVADFVVAGLQGSPYYLWPMLRLTMARARAVAVHGEPLRAQLAEEFPGTPLTTIAMGVPDPWQPPTLTAGAGIAPTAGSEIALTAGSELGLTAGSELGLTAGSELGLTAGSGIALTAGSESRPYLTRGEAASIAQSPPPTADCRLPTAESRFPSLPTADCRLPTAEIVLSAFGLITPEKRILPILRALAAIRDEARHVRLRLVGEIGEYYALWQDVARTGTRDLVEVTGYVDEETLAAELRAADVCLCLRWPTAHETSASWLRCLAAGKPTIVPDQLTTVDVPTLDPRHWQLKHTRDDAAAVFQPPDASRAVAVSIELQDEEAMVRQALRRLVADAELRASLGRRAREWWRAHHTVARMQRDYLRVLPWAADRPLPDWPADAPAHLRPDPSAWARDLVAPFGVDVDLLRRG